MLANQASPARHPDPANPSASHSVFRPSTFLDQAFLAGFHSVMLVGALRPGPEASWCSSFSTPPASPMPSIAVGGMGSEGVLVKEEHQEASGPGAEGADQHDGVEPGEKG